MNANADDWAQVEPHLDEAMLGFQPTPKTRLRRSNLRKSLEAEVGIEQGRLADPPNHNSLTHRPVE